MLNNVELLSPVGDFECLKAAVQNGADAVYLGSSDFNARSSATNFSLNQLEEAIDYAHLRNVKVYLALNTLIKNSEFTNAIELAISAYNYGIDAIIVQDLGLADYLIHNLPDLPIHASTQMTCHNLAGAKYLKDIGFKRIVLSRELSFKEIEYIRNNIDCELEMFIHGALCISYSGSCLYSSIIGGRSGNRGKCAQACRLPYKLFEDNTKLDEGYLLSPRDLCGLEFLPQLISMGVNSFKIEGRMKTPEYVAVVTRIYRKYINKVLKKEDFIIDEIDKKDLVQVFNRGGFSHGHLDNNSNLDLVYKEKPNNMGIYIGHISNYNSNKGLVSLQLNDKLSIGDTITFEKENSKYHVSELMIGNDNVESAESSLIVKFGRMKGNINIGDKVFKLEDKSLFLDTKKSYSIQNKKVDLKCELNLKLNKNISLKIYDNSDNMLEVSSDVAPIIANNKPITKDRLVFQLNKTNDTPFRFKNIKINMDDNLFIPNISIINELRRNAISEYSKLIVDKYKRNFNTNFNINFNQTNKSLKNSHNLCVLLSQLHLDYDYSSLSNIDKLYIPLNYFLMKEFTTILEKLANNFNIYIYMPIIIRDNYQNLFKNAISNAVNKYHIKGFVISNIGNFEFLKEYYNLEFIANYSINIFNNATIDALNAKTITISPELSLEEINDICNKTNFNTEFIVYGSLPLMTLNYCLLGRTNKCYPTCNSKCSSNYKYYLNDRLNFRFRIIPDNLQTITTLYNSKITSIQPDSLNVNNYRIDILDENIQEINNIINTVIFNTRFEGKDFTNGNLNKIV